MHNGDAPEIEDNQDAHEPSSGNGKGNGDQPTAAHDRLTAPVDTEEPPRLPFPVVGMGASAGGLEAYTAFFQAMPPDSGMAFVLVQHLPPDRESLMADILGRHTQMPVAEVIDGVAIEPNHVYVIRPGRTLTIKDGRLHLGQRLTKPGNNRPVDDFFKSLAAEQRERAVAIILSGMGSNGSAGAQAVKAVGGLCIAQDPETAQFPSMPRSMIDAGYADYILRVADMPDQLIAYAGHPYAKGGREDPMALLKRGQHHLTEILAILRTRTKQDFAGYKKPTVFRRVQRRMGLTRVTKVGDYAKILRQSPSEVTALADDLLIHVTGFFRDPDAWEALRKRVIVPMVAGKEAEGSLRCWVTACSSGEEAYTLAILLMEEVERANKFLDIKVFATDMAERSLANARSGTYPGGIESEISPERLARFFHKDDAVYRVRPDLRERVVFAPQNVLQDPPFSRLDIVTCRNLLIYLEPEVQRRVVELLHFGLREGGTLFLGTSETIGSAEELFEPIDKRSRIFRRVGPTRHGTVTFPIHRATGTAAEMARESRGTARTSMAQMTTRSLLEHHTPAAVTVDREYRIVYFHGNTEPFLAQPRGEPTRDILQMARESVRGAVRTALHRATNDNMRATVLDGFIETEPGVRTRIAIVAAPLDPKSAPDYFVVSFQSRGHSPAGQSDADAADGGNGSAKGKEAELTRVREELQSAVEELQTANEELKASNEEVMSINEELQSTNEELETSREEMQSLNEELSTVNAQLQSKMEEHKATGDHLASLLSSTDIAVLFLDAQLRIRRYTPAVKSLVELIPADVGRPLNDLAMKFTDPALTTDAAEVLEKLVPIQKEMAGDRGHWYIRRVLPYRTADNRIDGVVITFVDITERRKAEEALRESESSFRAVADLVPDLLWRNDPSGFTIWHNRNWTEYTGQSAETAHGYGWLQTIHPDDRERFRAQLRGPANPADVLRHEHRIRGVDGTYRWFLVQARPVLDGSGRIVEWFGAASDIHQQRTAIEALRESELKARLTIEGVRDFAMFTMDLAGRISSWNPAAERLLGWTEAEATGNLAAIVFTPEDRAAGMPEKEQAEAAANGRAIDERWHITKAGRRFWGSGVMTAVKSADGQVERFIKIFRDETARKQAELALQAAVAEAEIASRMKDEFLATLSHELRTPLSAILLWANMLKSRPFEQEQFDDAVAAIKSSADAQKELIDDLLDMSRVTSGQMRMDLREVELTPLVREATDAILPTAEARGVELTTDFGDDVGTVRCDAGRLRQVVWNLLTNAVKFTPAGGRVAVGLWRRPAGIEIRVTDTGRGIDPAFLPHVFERFRQADVVSTRTQGGLGLGLAICKQLVELHGGTIEAASEGNGLGSTFTIRLPLPAVRKSKRRSAATAAAGTSAKGDDAAKAGAAGGLAGLNVLLVEDDENSRTAMAMLLRGAGVALVTADSAAAAFEAYVSAPPDLIISDIGLPGEDGLSLIRRIRDQEREAGAPAVPAIAVSAFAREQDRRAAIDAGFQRHMGKPIDPESLLTAMRATYGV